MHICADLGGTRSAAALYDDDGNQVARFGPGPAGAVSLGVPVTTSVLGTLAEGLGAPDPATCHLLVGLAGIGLRDRVAELKDALSAYRSVTIVGDGYGALIDATGGTPGMVIAIGTGVAAMRLYPDGTSRTASGWGFPAGDLGSGAWIGLQAVGVLTRALDNGAQGLSAFHNALADQSGRTAHAVMDLATSRRAGDFARLAPIVVRSAEDGDTEARAILTAAANEIQQVADALSDGDSDMPVHLSGGLGAVLAPYLCDRDPARTWVPCAPDPLRGLSLMHRGLAPMEILTARPGLGLPDY